MARVTKAAPLKTLAPFVDEIFVTFEQDGDTPEEGYFLMNRELADCDADAEVAVYRFVRKGIVRKTTTIELEEA